MRVPRPGEPLSAAVRSVLAPRLLVAAAVASGGATLVYELSWMRLLTLSVGATFPAITVVLAGFMLGLGLGSVLGGRLVDRGFAPARTYALVELSVALASAVFPLLADVVGRIDVHGVGPISGRAVVAGVLLVPATTLMGTTFPLLSAALHRGDAGATHVPRLYAANTAGAAIGAIFGGLVLPFVIGVPPTLVVAAVGNLVAAVLGALAARATDPSARPSAVASDTTAGPPIPALLLVLAAGSGVLVMLAELFWTRSILQVDPIAWRGLVVEPTDVMTLVLVLVLAGNALGAALVHRYGDLGPRDVARVLAWTWAAAGVTSLGGLAWFGAWMFANNSDMHSVARGAGFVLLLPTVLPSILLGFAFPLLARLYAGALEGHGRRMGVVWLANTAGALVGSIAGGWWLMPAIGSDHGIVLCGVLAIALAGVSAWYAGARQADVTAVALGAVGVVAVAALVPQGPGQWYRRTLGEDAVVAATEGWEATTLVVRAFKDYLLVTNGRMIPGHSSYINGGRMAGGLAPDADEVLLVGFGTGLFAQGITELPGFRHLTIVEIDGSQFLMARWFGSERVLHDPRVTIVVDDALHYLAVTKKQFDLVVVDSWGPPASPAIYSKEFHERVLAHLAPDGLIWAKVNGGEMLPASVTPVVDAARCTYPHSSTMNGPDGSVFAVIGSRQALPDEQNQRPLATGGTCQPLSIRYPQRLYTKDG